MGSSCELGEAWSRCHRLRHQHSSRRFQKIRPKDGIEKKILLKRALSIYVKLAWMHFMFVFKTFHFMCVQMCLEHSQINIFPPNLDSWTRCGWDLAELWMRPSRVVDEIWPSLWMRSSRVCGWHLAELWMRSSRVVRASDSQCRSRNCPGFEPSILRHSGIWGTADEFRT